MPKLTIDGQPVEVAPGSTILDAARKLGLSIPTLCFAEGIPPRTSCFVCVVKVDGRSGLAPACATPAHDGMEVESETEEVREARQTALELLISDHLGDCFAPCQLACPARMNIPLMIRQIAAGAFEEAIRTIKRDIALPAVLGRVCSAPCEKACRRGQHDRPVAICLLKRYAADADLGRARPCSPERAALTGKKVAIVGAGPAGLSTAYDLLAEGYACTIFDDHEEPGGMLRYGVPESELPRRVLAADIRIIEDLGAQFRMGTRVGTDLTLDALRREFDAVMVAVGEMNDEKQRLIGLKASRDGIEADGHTFATGLPGVFAGGDAVRRRRMAVRACADGKVAATAIHQHLSGLPVTGVPRPFTTHYGRLTPEEMVHFMAGASAADRTAASGEDGGFTDEEARQESGRCLHCDCRKQTGCRLRQQCASYGVRTCERIGCLIPEAVVGDADPPKCSTKRMFSSDGGTRSPRPPIFSHVLRLGRFKGPRRTFERADVHPEIIYESGKCIDCGLCIQIAAGAEERLGLTFVGRGFNVRVGVPFGESVAAGLRRVGRECAAACPTGALALRDKGR